MKSGRNGVLLGLFVAMCMVFLPACNVTSNGNGADGGISSSAQPEPGMANESPAETPVEQADSTAVRASELAAEASEPILEEALSNGNFLDWEDGAPAGWEVLPAGVAQPVDESDPSQGVTLETQGTRHGILRQTLELDLEADETPFVATVECVGDEGSVFSLILTYELDGERKTMVSKYQATGTWATLSVSDVLPMSIDDGALHFTLGLDNSSTASVRVKNASLKIASK